METLKQSHLTCKGWACRVWGLVGRILHLEVKVIACVQLYLDAQKTPSESPQLGFSGAVARIVSVL